MYYIYIYTYRYIRTCVFMITCVIHWRPCSTGKLGARCTCDAMSAGTWVVLEARST